jgi:hypothetical protein
LPPPLVMILTSGGWQRFSRRRFNVDRFDATKAGITVGQEQRPSGIPAGQGDGQT